MNTVFRFCAPDHRLSRLAHIVLGRHVNCQELRQHGEFFSDASTARFSLNFKSHFLLLPVASACVIITLCSSVHAGVIDSIHVHTKETHLPQNTKTEITGSADEINHQKKEKQQ